MFLLQTGVPRFRGHKFPSFFLMESKKKQTISIRKYFSYIFIGSRYKYLQDMNDALHKWSIVGLEIYHLEFQRENGLKIIDD
jgi:hypothetical protein